MRPKQSTGDWKRGQDPRQGHGCVQPRRGFGPPSRSSSHRAPIRTGCRHLWGWVPEQKAASNGTPWSPCGSQIPTQSERTHLDARFSTLAAHANDPWSSRNDSAKAHPPLQTSVPAHRGIFPTPHATTHRWPAPWPHLGQEGPLTQRSPHTQYTQWLGQHGAVDRGECHRAGRLGGERDACDHPICPVSPLLIQVCTQRPRVSVANPNLQFSFP